jgi:predicted dehydrogenase
LTAGTDCATHTALEIDSRDEERAGGVPRAREIRVGLVGTGWIVRAHAHALHTIGHLAPLPARIRLVSIYGRREESVAAAAAELGFERWTTDWRALVEDPGIDVVANAGPNALHAPVSLAALAAGKHVLCEKPLAATAEEARAMEAAAARAGVRAACGFNYRFVPAVRLLHGLLHGGRLGTIRHYRGSYLQDWLSANPDWPSHGGGSAVADYSHLADMLRHLAGEPRSMVADVASFLSPTDDAFQAVLRLPGGGTAVLDASRCATGWKGRHRIEIEGTEGSAWWDMEDLNRLHVLFLSDQEQGAGGFRDVLVTEATHPFLAPWWPAGHIIGWEHTFAHQWRAFLAGVLDPGAADPLQASFADGARAAELGEAIQRAAREGRRVALEPQPVPAAVGGGA